MKPGNSDKSNRRRLDGHRSSREGETESAGPAQQPAWVQEEQLHLLSLSGTLTGLSITGVILFHTLGRGNEVRTIADDILAGSALLLLVCTYFIFSRFERGTRGWRRRSSTSPTRCSCSR